MSIKENDDSHEEETIVPAQQQNTSSWMAFLKCCGLCCYVACPPVPEIISRKVAFHPPQKGLNYTLKMTKDPERVVSSADKLSGEEFSIIPKCPKKFDPHGNLHRIMMTQVKPFIVHDARGHNIVAVKCAFSDLHTDSQQVIIFAQPNSSDLGAFLHPAVFNLVRMSEVFECDVYAFDYSGYGYSSGVTSEKNVYTNIEAMFNYVKEKNPNKKIVLIGYSLGTAVMTYMASKQPSACLSGLVLIAPFTSGMRIFANNPEVEKSNFLDRFKTVERIKDINVPVLLIHGTDDDVIPVAHSVRLHPMLKHPVSPLFLHGADHQTIFSLAAYPTFRRIRSFMADETFLGGVRVSNQEGQSEETSSTNKKD